MGRGRWGSRPPQAEPQIDPSILMQAQAMMQTRQTLQDRMRALEAALATSPLQAGCLVTLDLAQRWGQVQCPQPPDTARIWVFLSGVVVEGDVPIARASHCLAVDGPSINWVACQSATAQTSDKP